MRVRLIIEKEIDIEKFREAQSLFDDNGNPKLMTNDELAKALKSEFNGGYIDALDILEDADWDVEDASGDKPLVTELRRTCYACPSQWEGATEDGEHVYIRYRWGFLSASVGKDDVYGGKHGDSLDGNMSDADMMKALSGVLRFDNGLLSQSDDKVLE